MIKNHQVMIPNPFHTQGSSSTIDWYQRIQANIKAGPDFIGGISRTNNHSGGIPAIQGNIDGGSFDVPPSTTAWDEVESIVPSICSPRETAATRKRKKPTNPPCERQQVENRFNKKKHLLIAYRIRTYNTTPRTFAKKKTPMMNSIRNPDLLISIERPEI